mmetsp:Transcript_38751/g.82320  ORF Transcript_38751/g.82320 Transcript_38751/m.82320 type:complete len:200 (+) Transcript_38751:936-1535(+)
MFPTVRVGKILRSLLVVVALVFVVASCCVLLFDISATRCGSLSRGESHQLRLAIGSGLRLKSSTLPFQGELFLGQRLISILQLRKLCLVFLHRSEEVLLPLGSLLLQGLLLFRELLLLLQGLPSLCQGTALLLKLGTVSNQFGTLLGKATGVDGCAGCGASLGCSCRRSSSSSWSCSCGGDVLGGRRGSRHWGRCGKLG